MEELTTEQEDFILEQSMEDYYERKEQEQRHNDNVEHITKRCEVCKTATDYNCDEFIELDYKGMFLPNRVAIDYANMITLLINSPRRTMLLGKENIKLSKQYTWKHFLDKLEGIYNEIKREKSINNW